MNVIRLAGAALAASLVAVPGLAQPKTTQTPAQQNPLLASNGDARASRIIGTDVYGSDNQKLGTVRDVLIGGKGIFAVISGHGKTVDVPFDNLQYTGGKIVLPDAGKEGLGRYKAVTNGPPRKNTSMAPASGAGNLKAGSGYTGGGGNKPDK